MQSGPSGAGEAAIMCNVGGEGWRGADTGVANENDEKDTRLFISSKTCCSLFYVYAHHISTTSMFKLKTLFFRSS